MKKILSLFTAFATTAMLFLTASAATQPDALLARYNSMRQAFILLCAILAALIVGCVAFTAEALAAKRKRRGARRNPTSRLLLIMMYATACFVLACTVFCFGRYQAVGREIENMQAPPVSSSTSPDTSDTTSENTTTFSEETTTPTTEPDPTFTPSHTNLSNPETWGISWDIIANGSIVDSYQRPEDISFGAAEDYFALPGVATFRGNNFRNSAVYGTADITKGTISKVWSRNIGSLNGWPGSGWTGQPLMVQWDDESKAIMTSMFADKRTKEGLVEVIHATLDGYVYFYDLEDGSYTRDPMYVGMSFKGSGSLDPRGYPILYVGSGLSNGGAPRMYAISLIDSTILYQRSGNDAFSQREWTAFDSAPLVDAETDTLIWPGENGILYTIKLNTQYDKAAGTLTLNPEETVRIRYYPSRASDASYWIGFEPSAVIVDRYLYISENGGMFFCIDLNTMELVWAQDTRDDSNSTPVFEWNGLDGGYIYTAPSLHWTANGSAGYICVYKLDAKTGEIVWEQKFDCYSDRVNDVSGGVQSSPILGKEGTELEGLIVYTIARTPNFADGKLVAFDTETGEIVWEQYMYNYAWSSPVAVYTPDGKAYIITCDSMGYMEMRNHQGEVISTLELGSNIEASPAVFEDMLVVGTRGQKVYGIHLG